MTREAGQRDKILDAFTSYLNKREDRPQGDYTQAISALHDMETSDGGEIVMDAVDSVVEETLHTVAPAISTPKPSSSEPTPIHFSELTPPTAPVAAVPAPVVLIEREPADLPLPSSISETTVPRAGEDVYRDHSISRAKPQLLPPYESSFTDDDENGKAPAPRARSIMATLEEAIASEPPEAQYIPAEEDEELEAIVRSHGRRRKSRSLSECSSCGRSPGKQGLHNCTACNIEICKSCGEYSKVHRQSQVFYDYKFVYPLCKDCYLNAFKIQEEIGRASTYYGTGNMTYAHRHAVKALELATSIPVGEAYVQKANNLMESVERSKTGMASRTNKSLISGAARRERPDRPPSKDIEGDKWAKRFVERALANTQKGE